MARNGNASNFTIENAELIFRNFRGLEDKFNPEGARNFCVLLPDDTAAQMEADGWNVKELRVQEPGDTPQKYLPVSIKYRGRNGYEMRPPTVVMITSKGRTNLPEKYVGNLDYVDIKNVDLTIRPYQWAMSGNTGLKAYLHAIYITIEEDYLSQKYSDVPEIGGGQQLAIESGEDDVWDAEVVEDEQKAIER